MKNLILTLLLFTVSCLFGQSLPEEYSDFYFDLQMLSSEKRLKNIEKAIESNPEDPWYYWMAASFYEIVDDKHNIVKNYEKAISLDSNFSAGHGSYARYLRKQENPDIQKALFHINKAIALDSNDAYFHIDRGEIYLLLKDYNSALEEANCLLSENQEQDFAWPAWELIVRLLHEQGKKEELKNFVVKHDFSQVSYFMSLDVILIVTNLYEEIGEHDKACLCFNNAKEPYEMSEMPLPEELVESLKKCK